MKKSFIVLLVFLNIALLTAVACAPVAKPPAGKITPSQPVPVNPPEFYVTDLKVNPGIASPGEAVRVSAKLDNNGGAGDYRAVLKLDGIENANKSIPVGVSGSSDIVFTLALNKMGRYQVDIGDLKTTLMISDCRQKNPYILKYEEGALREDSMYGVGSMGQITRFTPPAIPFTVQKILLYTDTVVENDAELDQYVATINLRDSNRAKVWSKDYPWRLFKGYTAWKEFTVDNINFSDDFIVEFVSHSMPARLRYNFSEVPILTCVTLGFNKPTARNAREIPQTRSGWSIKGISVEPEAMYTGLNWLIRVEGQGCLLENKIE
jgi:hypothetical protein